MDVNYIIVQAGGRGSRMEHLTTNKPKALVPIDNLPMLFYLFRKYPDKRFLVISDYKIDVMRKYLAVFAQVDYLVVDAKGKKGTCSGIAEAMSKIPEDESFMLIWSDLILGQDFEFPEKTDDYVGLAKDFPCRWSYEDGKFQEVPSEAAGVAGVFLCKNKKSLSGVPEEGEFVRWLQSQGKHWNTIGLHKTREYGLISEYNKLAEKKLGRCRAFNKITIDGDRLIKEGIDEQGKQLAVRERAWYRMVAQKGFGQIPQIYEYEPKLIMQKIKGKNIYEYTALGYEEKKNVLYKLVNSLKELHSYASVPTDYFSVRDAYVDKTWKRLDKIRDMVPFGNQQYITINGRKCRNVFFYKDEVERFFEQYVCKEFVLIHGDNTFSNMMLDENLEPIMIDPRGYFGKTSMYGDANYDWAKLYYSLVGNYDQFNLSNYRLTIKEDEVELSIESNHWEDMEDYFFSLVGEECNRNDIKMIHAIIWLSLTTYAWEDYDSVCGAFYNGLYYLEEVL